MKNIFLVLIFMLSIAAVADADIVIHLSTSNASALAGSNLTLEEGSSGSMFVWVENNSGGTIDGLSLDILSDDSIILEANAFNIENPAGRWFATGSGTLGDLVDDSNAFVLISETGIVDGALALHGEVVFDATALGNTNLQLGEGAFEITVNGVATQDVNFGSGTVNVIPEPSALWIFGVVGFGFLTRRRKRQ